MLKCLVPLYLYPVSGATWQPLYEAIEAHPTLQFVVIINPDSGPGSPSPDAAYLAELQHLAQYGNVLTIGYVRTDYCRRAMTLVDHDLATYGTWTGLGVGLGGIFFDETPWEYTAESYAYLKVVSERARSTAGIQGPRLIMHNPGCTIAPELEDGTADVTVAFEADAEQFGRLRRNSARAKEGVGRAARSLIVHSTLREEQAAVVRAAAAEADYVFVTTRTAEHYNGFGPSWLDMVRSLAELDSEMRRKH